MDCSPPGSSVHGIFQAGILELLPLPPSGDLPNRGIKPESLVSPALVGGFFTMDATWGAPVGQAGEEPWLTRRSGDLSIFRFLFLPFFLMTKSKNFKGQNSREEMIKGLFPIVSF